MEEAIPYKISVLITCYNRREKTLSFLESLVKQDYFGKLNIDIYLLDDASNDGTSAAVNAKYPAVNIIKGTGNLFWAGGMRTLWKHVAEQKDYDLFLLFNDDIVLFDGALENLIKNYTALNKNGVILIGSTQSPESNKITYGGILFNNIKHSNYYRAMPDDTQFVPCQSGNANVLLIDKYTVERIGIFSDAYTHYLADFDYVLTAYKNGIEVVVAPGYYAYCEYDHGVNWLSGKHPLKKRIAYLYDVKGLAYKEYLYYIKKHFPSDYLVSFLKLWTKTLFPIIWDKFKVKENY